ncbi:MAG TPA: cytidine deaminase [Fimbriimonas sp.]
MEDLVSQAVHARQNAYAPYSGYAVGCALRTAEGRVFVGANVENVSYGATLCAERAALGAMATQGDRSIVEIAVATVDGGSPCGICLQALSEFVEGEVPIRLIDGRGEVETTSFRALFPRKFSSTSVNRTERA